MSRPIAKALIGFAILAGALLVGGVWFVSNQTAPQIPHLPNPNGYVDLLRAGNRLEEDVDYTTMADPQLRAAVAKNAEVIGLTEKALERESQVVLNYSATSSAHLSELSVIKRLGLALMAQGKLAEIDHRPREAAHAYLNAVRLGHHAERGGIIIDSMVATAVEALGISALDKLTPQLTNEECGEVAARLESIERGRESAETILAEERVWARRTFGFKGILLRLMTFKQLQAGEQRWTAKRKAQVSRTHALLTRLGSSAGTHGPNQNPLAPNTFLDNVPR